MANIWDGIKCMGDDELRLEIGLFQQVSFGNAARETKDRLISGLADVADSLLKSLGGRNSISYEVVSISDKVKADMKRLEALNRDDLIDRLTKLLMARFNDIVSEDEAVCRDRLSNSIATEAGLAYGLDKYEVCDNKLENLSIEYNKALLKGIHDVLVNQSKEEAAKTDRLIQKGLDAIGIEEKRQLHKLIMPKEFSGTGIGRVLRLERDTKNLTYVLDIAGVNCFDEVYVHTYTTVNAVRALRKISRVLLAQLVWAARKAYGRTYSMDESILPSYAAATDTQLKESDKEFRENLLRKNRLSEVCDKALKACENNTALIIEADTKLETLTSDALELEDRFEKLKSQKERYVEGHMPEEDTKQYYSEVNESSRQYERAEALVQKQRKHIEELQAKGGRLNESYAAAVKEKEQALAMIEKTLSETKDFVQVKWSAYYYGFRFDADVFEQVALEFNSEERLVLEHFLKNIYDSRSYRQGKTMDGFRTQDGKLCVKVSVGKTAYIGVNEGVIVKVSNQEY